MVQSPCGRVGEDGDMAEDRNKYQSRENRAKVREVLMQEWDPIGVRNVPEA